MPDPYFVDLALQVDALLTRPKNMAEVRKLVESYLDRRTQAALDVLAQSLLEETRNLCWMQMRQMR